MMDTSASESLNESKESINQVNDPVTIYSNCSVKRRKERDEKLRQQKERHKIQEEEKLRRDLEKRKKDVEKEQERKKREIEKEEERKKKDDERKRKEEEKKLRQAEKDVEKRKRDEEKRIKDVEREEERRKKDEDKKRREEEKRKDDNEKNKILKKPRTSILDFFLKKDKIDQDQIETSHSFQNISFFKPIEVKKDMKMAALERTKKSLLLSISCFDGLNYMQEIENNTAGSLVYSDTWRISEPDCEVFEPSLSRRLPTKSFLFAENVRPPYFGTWRKVSKFITPLNPLFEDVTILDYEVDSDQEWEYESGEDISNSEGEEEEEVNDDVDDNSFLVPHGYLSDGEDFSDVDIEIHTVNVNSNKRSMSPKSRQSIIEIREKQFQAEVKQKVQIINPNIVGPFFVDNDNALQIKAILEPYRMICQTTDGFPINCNLQSDVDHSITSNKMKSVPNEAIPLLIRLLHHNSLSRAKICYEFRMYWEYHLTNKLPDVTFDDDMKGRDWDEFTIGKKRLIDKIKEIAERKEGKWVVKPEVIHEYQLCCLDDDPLKACSEQWKYVSEVFKEEILKKKSRKSKLIDDINQKVFAKVPKEPKKRIRTSIVSCIKDKVVEIQHLNPSVQLVDNLKEHIREGEAKGVICTSKVEDILKELC